MCDYSLNQVKSRPAAVGDKLITTNFGTGSRGFAGVEDRKTAVCVLPGTELAFDEPIRGYSVKPKDDGYKTAIFRQIDKEQPHRHHDTIELPDGSRILLTYLAEDQTATVLQLPAAPRTEAEKEEQRRVEVVG